MPTDKDYGVEESQPRPLEAAARRCRDRAGVTSPEGLARDGSVLGDPTEAWKARGRELNELYDALTAVVEEPAPGMDPVADLKALGAQRDRLRVENEALRELLRRARPDVVPQHLADEIDAALAESPSPGPEEQA